MRKGKGHFADVAIHYAERVARPRVPEVAIIACEQIRQSCETFLRAVEGDTWVFDASKVERVCLFMQAFPYLEGALAAQRKTLTLQPWQVWINAAIFGLVDGLGFRKHREAFIEIPRKNGKSTYAAAIALYMLVADYESRAQVYIGANDLKQADFCFQPCREMALRADSFVSYYGAIITKKKIELPDGSFMERMIGNPGDGGNPHCAILDEAHENASDEQRLTMKTGMGARQQPLLVTITTAGFNTAGPCRDLQAYAEQVLSGELTNDKLFSAIYTIDKDDDWRDFDVWKKANPNMGVSFSVEALRDYYQTALDKPSEKPKLLTKHLNVWQSSSNAWVNMKDWDNNGDALPFDEVKDRGLRAWIGCDISRILDTTAIGLIVEEIAEAEPVYHFYPYIFLPEMGVDRSSKNASAYREWAERGELILTPDEETDFDAVEKQLRQLCGQFNVQGIAFDQWQAAMMAQRLGGEGLPVRTYPQTFPNMHPPMSRFEKLIALGQLKHDGNRMMRWMTGNVVARHHGEFIKPEKPARRPESKIDGFVAMMMAVGLASAARPAQVEIWMDVLD